MITNYQLGVLCQRTLTDHQAWELAQHARDILPNVEGLVLRVPGFSLADPRMSIDPAIRQLAKQLHTKGCSLEVGAFDHKPCVDGVRKWLEGCDEYLAFPSSMRRRFKGQDRVWSFVRAHSAKVKVVGPWSRTETDLVLAPGMSR